MEDRKEKVSCNGRCEMCNINQRTYCAAQMSYYNQEEIGQIRAILDSLMSMNNKCIILKEKVSKIEENEEVSEPTVSGADE
ncbi:MAG: hypothetical protein ACI4N3_01895 [Alphaproteobacteria bacterium]